MNLFRHSTTALALVFSIGLVGRVWGELPLPTATNLWTLTFPNSFNTSSSTPAIADDGTIYLGTFYGNFLAMTPQGKIKWDLNVNCEIKSSPAIADDGTIYFGSRNRNFYAVAPSGKIKWVFKTGAWVDSSPAIAVDGTVYFGSWDKYFYALNPDGSLKWKFAVGAIVDSSPAIAADGTIYFGAHDKKFYALNPDGKVRWKFSTGGGIVSSPAIGTGGVVYFSSLDGNLYALDPDGSERWHYHSGSTTESSPIVDANGNICIGHNQNTQVVSPVGRLQWLSGSAVPVDVSAAAVAGRFYFSVPWRTLQAVMPVDHRIWKIDLNGNVSASLVVGMNGIIYVCDSQFLHAIRPPGEALPPAESPWPMFRANARHTGRVNQ